MFQPFLAVRAIQIRIHHAAHAGEIARLEASDRGANFGHATDDFMTRHGGKLSESPLVAGVVKIGVANAAVEDLDLHITLGGISAGNAGGCQRGGGGGGGICFGGVHRIWFLESRRPSPMSPSAATPTIRGRSLEGETSPRAEQLAG